MWVNHELGQEPELLANDASDNIGAFVRRSHPSATIYVCSEPNAYILVRSHQQATEMVTVDQPSTDNIGETITIQVRVEQSLGNTVEVDSSGPALLLLDHTGAEVSRLPLQIVQ